MGFQAKYLIALILHAPFALLWIFTGSVLYLQKIYGPSVWFPQMGKGHLKNSGPSTNKFDDLVVKKWMTVSEAEKIAHEHGLAIVESVLTKETSENFRNYILEANHKLKSAYVHEAENRFHIMPDHDEPAVQAAMIEIGKHPVIRLLLDRLLGPNCSLVGFSVVTNLYGSEDQQWHYDALTSHAGYPDEFVPEYTLAIPVQDTTREMGATGICPGTHKANWPDFDYAWLEQQYLSNKTNLEEYDNFDDWLVYHMPCDLTVNVSAGDGMLYSTDVTHRGRGHKDPDAPERVVAFWIFAGSRQGPDDKRFLPLGQVHSLAPKSWGHTIDDFETINEKPWRPWHSIGLFTSKENGVKPWTILHDFLLIFRGPETSFHAFANEIDIETFFHFASEVFLYFFIATGVYLTMVPIWMSATFFSIHTSQSSHDSKKN